MSRDLARVLSRLLVALVITIAAFGEAVAAATHYADPAVTDPQCLCGSTNFAACGAMTKPYKCLVDALNEAAAGDTVIAKNGTYSECILLNKSGTSTKRITVRAMNSRLATISNPASTTCNSSDGATILWTANYVTLSGFKVAGNAGTSGIHFTNITSATQVVNQLLDVETYGSLNGVVVDGPRNAIRDSLIRNHVAHGIVVGSSTGGPSAANTEITRVESRFNGADGVVLDATAQPSVLDTVNAHDNQGNEGGVVVLVNSNLNTLTNTTANYNLTYGVYIAGANNTLIGGVVSYNGSRGIQLYGTNNLVGTDTASGPDIHHNVQGIKLDGTDNVITNSHIHHNAGQGILVASTGTQIKKCEVDNNGSDVRYDHGIYIDSGSISDCRIHHNAAFGIHMYPAPVDVVVERNDIYGNGTLSRGAIDLGLCPPYGEYTGGYSRTEGGGMIVFGDAQNVTVRYNRVHHNNGVGVAYTGCNPAPGIGGNTFHHNTIYENRGNQIGLAYADPGSVKFLSNIVVNPERPNPDPEPDRRVYLVNAYYVTLEADAFDGNLYDSNASGVDADTCVPGDANTASTCPFVWNDEEYSFNEFRTTQLPMLDSPPDCPTTGPASLMDQHTLWATNLALVDPTTNRWDTGQDSIHSGNYHLISGSSGITGGVCCAVSNNGVDIDGETPSTCTPIPACDTPGNGVGADYYRDTDGDGTANRYDCNPSSSGNSNTCDGDSSSAMQESSCVVAYPGAVYDPSVYPAATEICDGKDNNCSGGPEPDSDRDGFFTTAGLCSASLLDCDDTRPRVYPGAQQFCDGVNNDCNTPGYDPAIPEANSDYDDWRVCGFRPDCNDSDCSISQDATEVCNGIDDNCSGCVDEGASCGCFPLTHCCVINSECCSGTCSDAICS